MWCVVSVYVVYSICVYVYRCVVGMCCGYVYAVCVVCVLCGAWAHMCAGSSGS